MNYWHRVAALLCHEQTPLLLFSSQLTSAIIILIKIPYIVVCGAPREIGTLALYKKQLKFNYSDFSFAVVK